MLLSCMCLHYYLFITGGVILTRVVKSRLNLEIDWFSDIIYWWNDRSIWRLEYNKETKPETRLYTITTLNGISGSALIQSVEIDFLNG